MRIRSAVGLKTSQWDMRVDVTPHIGGALGRAISQAAQSEYKVTGSWDKPDIVKIGSRG